MQREQEDRLRRYFLNANPFLWGVLEAKNNPEANKRARIRELKASGFLRNYSEGTSATYSKINRDLLVELGIKDILKRIVIPRVTDAFPADVLIYFHRCWDQGQNPRIEYLIQHKLYERHRRTSEYETVPHKDPAQVFVWIDTQHEFVERWTVFAGLWFEEIPYV